MRGRIRKLANGKFVAEVFHGSWLFGNWYGLQLNRHGYFRLQTSTEYPLCVGSYGDCIDAISNQGFSRDQIEEYLNEPTSQIKGLATP